MSQPCERPLIWSSHWRWLHIHTDTHLELSFDFLIDCLHLPRLSRDDPCSRIPVDNLRGSIASECGNCQWLPVLVLVLLRRFIIGVGGPRRGDALWGVFTVAVILARRWWRRHKGTEGRRVIRGRVRGGAANLRHSEERLLKKEELKKGELEKRRVKWMES